MFTAVFCEIGHRDGYTIAVSDEQVRLGLDIPIQPDFQMLSNMYDVNTNVTHRVEHWEWDGTKDNQDRLRFRLKSTSGG